MGGNPKWPCGKRGVVAMLLASALAAPTLAGEPAADLILRGGAIYTAD